MEPYAITETLTTPSERSFSSLLAPSSNILLMQRRKIPTLELGKATSLARPLRRITRRPIASAAAALRKLRDSPPCWGSERRVTVRGAEQLDCDCGAGR